MPALSQSLSFITYTNTSSVAVVYPNTATTTLIYISERQKGDGYFGGCDGLHTVMYTATPTFVGTVTMQATLASEPVEKDWFPLESTKVTYTEMDSRSTSTVDYFNFTGNFVWIRGVVGINAGTVESILYNH